ncbi:MAG: MoxR family ATPase, partial [Spirochaetaceae bacterium]|nr:MoxR family ATPase [Spirochaetaceae bacterium]
DLLPGDITGMNIWDDQKREFRFNPGPVFHSFLLADELNRAASRTQAALLEAMQESQVTTDGETRSLPEDFFVMATQNPSQYSGTFALPEAQLDRFGLSFSLGWPEEQMESTILTLYKSENPADGLKAEITGEEIAQLRQLVRQVKISDELAQWIVKLGTLSRKSNDLKNGFSTRGLQHLLAAAQGHALWEGRDFIIPEDILELAPWVARHKLQVSAEMKINRRQADFVIKKLQETLEIPV